MLLSGRMAPDSTRDQPGPPSLSLEFGSFASDPTCGCRASSRSGPVRGDREAVEIEGSWPTRDRSGHLRASGAASVVAVRDRFWVDAASFASLDETTRAGLVWVFAHRFHAEFNVAVLLAPFLLAALTTIFGWFSRRWSPTSIGISSRCCASTRRGSASEVGSGRQPLADAARSGGRRVVRDARRCCARARGDRDEDTFLRAVVAYHLLAEGSIDAPPRRSSPGSSNGSVPFPACGRRNGSRCATRCATSASATRMHAAASPATAKRRAR